MRRLAVGGWQLAVGGGCRGTACRALDCFGHIGKGRGKHRPYATAPTHVSASLSPPAQLRFL